MLPRTERCSKDTGLLPLAVNLTFFMCVFMAWSTPVTVPEESLRRELQPFKTTCARQARAVSILEELTLNNAAVLELNSDTLLPQLHEEPGRRVRAGDTASELCSCLMSFMV